MDLFDWIIVWFVAVVVIMIGAVILGETQKKKVMQNSEKRYNFNTTHQYGDFKVDKNAMRFIVSYYTGTSRAYHISEVSGWELVEDGQHYKSEGGVLRAVVGGALFGGTGALVGAATAKRTPSVSRLQVNIYTTDLDTPLVVVHCLHNQPGQYTDTNSIVYRDACNTAHSIMAVLQSMQLEYENYSAVSSKISTEKKKQRLESNMQTQPLFPRHGKLPDNYIVLDIETTGLEPEEEDIVEISIVNVVNKQPKTWYTRLIKPKAVLPLEVSKINGITNEMIQDKPYIETVIDDILEFIGDSTIIGYNVNFAIKFLSANSPKILTNKTVDVAWYCREWIEDLEHYRLKDVSAYFNVKNTNKPRSLNDCLVIHKCYEILKERYEPK